MRLNPTALVVRSLQLLFSLACLGTAAYALAYLWMHARDGDPFASTFAASGWDVPAHFFGAGLALALVPLQLSTRIRRRWPGLHRTGGLLSVAAIVVGGVSGLSLAQDAQGGRLSRTGFSLLALLWLGITVNGLRLALLGQFARHRTWMAYSLSLTAGAITLRVMLAVGAGMLQWPFMTVYVTAAWASWLFNLAVCAAWLRWTGARFAAPGGRGTRWAFRRQDA